MAVSCGPGPLTRVILLRTATGWSFRIGRPVTLAAAWRLIPTIAVVSLVVPFNCRASIKTHVRLQLINDSYRFRDSTYVICDVFTAVQTICFKIHVMTCSASFCKNELWNVNKSYCVLMVWFCGRSQCGAEAQRRRRAGGSVTRSFLLQYITRC